MSRRNANQIVEIRKHQLTEQQLKAIELLAQGKTDQEAADAVGVGRPTVGKWRRYDVWFVAELNRRRQGAWAACEDRLRAMLSKALDAIERELGGENALSAAVQVFRLAGLEKAGPPTGQDDADAEIESMAEDRRDAMEFDGTPVTKRERAVVIAEIEKQLGVSDDDGLTAG